ncbi:Isopentenyldiphosphate isomerase [Paenibacillus sophorae]|uniref:Isopentenyldiphosphate isomerase n=1 Tax=Paenibacillus sophorae TaxID=1333845 RepID=A0A1H8NQW7_9BACL|nr:NUDIX domain-containing protein [Paenibacillus sophorae]QWU14498.1 NUDIX domain-containing protein [Paenibacillus sophorae]SEO32051.1 Isopentenyldiphosphate isomerase [Paenibacillus sophorae]
MPLPEMFDIFDEKMIRIGSDSRENAHAKGLWHQTFHCWIVHPAKGEGGSLLFQLRHMNKDTFPGHLDTSCAGHLQAGETVEDGVRELREELGLSVPFEELVYCGMVAEENIPSDGLIDREFSHVFLHTCEQELERYSFQLDEISGLFFVDILKFRQLVEGETDALRIEGIVWDEKTQLVRPEQRVVSFGDFTPNSNEYNRMLFEHLGSDE